VPSPLLESGMCLVDTPGLGSVFEGNTAVTQGFVPHIDAALVVLGADPPISADELALVEKISTHTSELIFVLSKSDRLPDGERSEARVFAERILAEKLGRPVTVLEVSASEQQSGTGPARDWPVLRDRLVTLAKQSGATLVHAAEDRGAQNFGKGIIRELTEHRDALLRPLEESQRRLDDLRACVAEAERSGVAVVGSEVVGLIPKKALEMAAEHFLRIQNFRPAMVLENRLAEAAPGGAISGRVASIDRTVNLDTRTVRVRIELERGGRALRPGMFVKVTLAQRAARVLAVPEDAVVATGDSAVAWIDAGSGEFQPRHVRTGRRGGGYVEIISGLSAGDSVAASGGFLIESESQLRAAHGSVH